MQVATLFRETATLLGASMEAQDTSGPETHSLKFRSPFADSIIKQEVRDDGYETCGDLELRSQADSHKLMNHLHITGNMGVKCEPPEDPYSFVDDDPTPGPEPRPQNIVVQTMPKKRGRKKKIIPDRLEDTENLVNGEMLIGKKLKDEKFAPIFKERKKHDRFNGMPEEEVSKRTLPDHLALNLDIVIIGINPGLFAAYKGHHYAGPGNHFWKCLYLSGLTPEPMTADDDYKLLQVGIGFTNMVARATKGSADLTRKEIKEGSQILLEKLQKFKPKIAVFNGKLIFEVFSGKKDFSFGRQPEFVDGTNTYMWVMPSSSARCAQLPRAADKVPFYAALKKFRDYLNGIIANLDESEVVFTDSKLKNYFEPEIKEEPKDDHGFYSYGRLQSSGELTDLSNAIVKKEEEPPAKKKRGRPKKIKSDCPEVKKTNCEPRRKETENIDVPKKKRGRPKKIKSEDVMLPSNNTSNIPNCFSPPIHSPSNFAQQNMATYNNQPLAQPYSQNQQSHSPSESLNYQSPVQSHHYNHSPQPSSQPFTHSDLSSEISAAISSEHNLVSPPPTSPSIGPPDFEPPTSMPEDTSNDPQNSSRGMGEEVPPNNLQKSNECRFSSPAPSNDSANINYQNYRSYQTDSETNHSIIGYSQGSAPDYTAKRNINQDVASKSLSGLESLVDQIPSIAEGEASHGAVVNSNGEEQFDSSHVPTSQFNDESSYLGVYPNSSQYNNGSSNSNSSRYSPQYTSSSANYSVSTSNSYSLHQSSASMNFSVTSLANSSASVNHEVNNQVSSSFSVSSLAASNFGSMNSNVNSYSNLISSPHPMGSHMMGSTNGLGGGMFGSGSIVERACSMGGSVGSLGSPVGLPNPMSGMNMSSSSLPYPYRQYSHGATSFAAGPGGGFSYASAHSLHMPSPNYPYPSPYSNTTYPQPSYLPNHVLDRIKQDRMDISFGGF